MACSKHYTSCPIHPSKSKIDCLSLGSVYTFLFDEDLDGAHNSLADANAQTTIIMHEYFAPYINHTQSITTIDKIFTAQDVAEWKCKMEPIRPVHLPWIELSDDCDIEWQSQPGKSYNGPFGGPNACPTQQIKNIAHNATTTADIFLGILPITFFEHVSSMTNKYCYEDWVVPCKQLDSNGYVKRKKMMVSCNQDTPGAQHRANKTNRSTYDITTRFVLVWVALLVLQGGHFRSTK